MRAGEAEQAKSVLPKIGVRAKNLTESGVVGRARILLASVFLLVPPSSASTVFCELAPICALPGGGKDSSFLGERLLRRLLQLACMLV